MSLRSLSHILVASDQPLEAQSMEGVLLSAGYGDVRATSDGREINKLYAKWPFTLLILDLGISSKSAFLVLSELAQPIESRKLGVLAISNEGDVDLQERAFAAGARNVFTRPFTPTEALVHVRGALEA